MKGVLLFVGGGASGKHHCLGQERDNVDFEIVAAGHIPHDENPEAVNKEQGFILMSTAYSVDAQNAWSIYAQNKLSLSGL